MRIFLMFILVLSLSCQNNQKVRQINGGSINSQEFDTPSEMVLSISKQDSLLYYELVSDYGNYWEAKITKTLKKQVLFDLHSGKIAIYNNRTQDLKGNNEPSDAHFSWEIDTINPYHIKGIYGEIEKDTLLFWNYNPKTNQIIDEKGFVFSRKFFNKL